MLSPRWSKVVKDLWNNKLRTVLVVLSIAVGVFAVGMIGTASQILTDDLSAAYLSSNPAHATLSVSTFDDNMVQVIRAMPGIAAAEGRQSVGVRYSTGPGMWRDLQLVVIPDYAAANVAKVSPQDGAWPPPRKEVLLERNSLQYIRHNIGDTLLVKTPQGKERTISITGSTHDMNQFPSVFTGVAYGYITFATLEWLGYSRGYGQLLIRFEPDLVTDKASVQTLTDAVQKKIEQAGGVVYWRDVPEPNKHPIDDIIQPMVMLLSVLGALALLLSGFLVINTISAVLTQQVRQIGIMKTVGASREQIMGIYYQMVLVFSVLAICIGVPAGALGGGAVGGYIASLLNFDVTGLVIPRNVLVLEILVGLLVPLLAALWPIWVGARITVHAALQGQGMGRNRADSGRLSAILSRLHVVSRPMLLSMRNTFRRKGRLALTLATLTLGGAIFIGVLSVHSSLGRTLDDALNYWRYDVEVNFGRAYRTERLVKATLQIPGVTQAECWAGFGARRILPDGRESSNFSLIAIPVPTTFLRPILVAGRWLLPGDENAVVLNTDVLKKETDIGVGSNVRLKINGKESEWHVVGIVRGIMMGSVGYANYAYAARITNQVGLAGQVLVVGEKNDPVYLSQLAKRLEADLKATGFQVRSTQTITDVRSMTQSQFNILVVFMLIMAVLLAVVGGLGLMGTMSINVLERTREIGVMRAIGASNWAMVQVFLVEGVFIGCISWVLGAFLSLPLSRLLTGIVGDAMLRAPLSYTFSFAGLGIWLLIVGVLAMLASLLPAWKAAKLTVRDVLAYE